MTKDDRLLVWLRDAHAMEKQAEAMLSAQSSRIESYPELKRKIEEHLAETRRQAGMLQSCIHMEIAAYEVLIATAVACGDQETVAVCQRILNEEVAMAAWLGENLSSVTSLFLSLEEKGASAKR